MIIVLGMARSACGRAIFGCLLAVFLTCGDAQAAPEESNVRFAILSRLPLLSEVKVLKYKVFESENGSGRVSVVGSYTLPVDMFERTNSDEVLFALLKSKGIEKAEAISLGQVVGLDLRRFGRDDNNEYIASYKAGSTLGFKGEFNYLETVEGYKLTGNLTYAQVRGESSVPPEGVLVGSAEHQQRVTSILGAKENQGAKFVAQSGVISTQLAGNKIYLTYEGQDISIVEIANKITFEDIDYRHYKGGSIRFWAEAMKTDVETMRDDVNNWFDAVGGRTEAVIVHGSSALSDNGSWITKIGFSYPDVFYGRGVDWYYGYGWDGAIFGGLNYGRNTIAMEPSSLQTGKAEEGGVEPAADEPLFQGEYQGSILEWQSKANPQERTYSVSIIFSDSESGGATLAYPEIDCIGTMQLEYESNGIHDFKESFPLADTACENGYVRLFMKDGTLNIVRSAAPGSQTRSNDRTTGGYGTGVLVAIP